jgi:hypothetical protein
VAAVAAVETSMEAVEAAEEEEAQAPAVEE